MAVSVTPRVPKRRLQRAVIAAKRENPTAPAWVLAKRAVKALGDPALHFRALAVARSPGAR